MAINLCPLCHHLNGFEEESNLKNHIRSTHLYMFRMSDNFLEHLTKCCVSEKIYQNYLNFIEF